MRKSQALHPGRGKTAKPRNRNLRGEAKLPQEEKQDAKESGVTSWERGKTAKPQNRNLSGEANAPGRKAGRERVRSYFLGEGRMQSRGTGIGEKNGKKGN